MEAKDYTMPYWLDEATGITYAKDDPTCGGAGQVHRGPAGQGCDYTCDDCHGSGVVPTDDCPEYVAKLIRDDNQRRVFDADEDWVVGLEGEEEE